MALDTTAPRSRRSLLTAAAGGAAALAASAAAPLGVAAAATNMQTETANTSAAETSLNDSADRTVGFKTTNVGVAPAHRRPQRRRRGHERRRHRPDGSGWDLDVCRGLRDIRGCDERCSVLGSDLHRRLRLRPQLVGDRPGLRAGRLGGQSRRRRPGERRCRRPRRGVPRNGCRRRLRFRCNGTPCVGRRRDRR